MSFDTRNAIARFIGWFRQDTREQVCVPPGFLKPLPLTHQNPYPWGRYGFSRVRVRVALGYPRVTRDNHYVEGLKHLPKLSNVERLVNINVKY